jgi:hypothetical protein
MGIGVVRRVPHMGRNDASPGNSVRQRSQQCDSTTVVTESIQGLIDNHRHAAPRG